MTTVWPNTLYSGNWQSGIDSSWWQTFEGGGLPAPDAGPDGTGLAPDTSPAVVIGQSPPPGPVFAYGPPTGGLAPVVQFPPTGLSFPAVDGAIADVRWGSNLPEPIEIDPGLQSYLEDRNAQSSYTSSHDGMQSNGGPWAQADAEWARMGNDFSTPGYELFLENFLINHFSPDMDPEFAESWLGSVVQRLNTEINLARAALPAGAPAGNLDLAAINASLNPKGMLLKRVYMPDKAFNATPGSDVVTVAIPSKLVLTYPGAPKPQAGQYDVAGGDWQREAAEAASRAVTAPLIAAFLARLATDIVVEPTSATLADEIAQLAPMTIADSQLGKKFAQHVGEVGLGLANRQTMEAYRIAAERIRAFPEQVRFGYYDSHWGNAYFFERNGLMVATDEAGRFITFHPIDPPQPNSRWEHAMPLPGSRM